MIIIMDNSWTICQKHIKTYQNSLSKHVTLTAVKTANQSSRFGVFWVSQRPLPKPRVSKLTVKPVSKPGGKMMYEMFCRKMHRWFDTREMNVRNCKLRCGAQMGPGACMQLYCTGAIGPLPEKNNKNERKRLCCFAQAALFRKKNFLRDSSEIATGTACGDSSHSMASCAVVRPLMQPVRQHCHCCEHLGMVNM